MKTILPSPVAICYASQSGRPTLDQGEGGGNPFASALIELLERPSLSYAELLSGMISVTLRKSNNFQEPQMQVPASALPTSLRLQPYHALSKRTALIFGYSDYSRAGLPSLPGVEHDLARVSLALTKAGFDVHPLLNPSAHERQSALEALSMHSTDADIAMIYTTGHGFEHDGKVFLVPNSHHFTYDPEDLSTFAIHLPTLATSLKAKHANMLFYGGCRSFLRRS